MKKIFTVLAAAAMFAACNSKSDLDTQKDVVATDPSKMYTSNASTDVSTAAPKEQAPTVAPTRTIIRERVVYINRTPRATHQTVREADPVEPVINTVPQSQSQANAGTASTQGTGTSVGTGAGEGTSMPSAAPVEKKKGWSSAAKDATIGGVGGAVVGAVLSRNKGKGAIIGGVLGGVGGYILGRKKDKANAGNLPNYAEN